MKLASGNTLVPSIMISADRGSAETVSSVSMPVAQGRQLPTSHEEPSTIGPPCSLAVPIITHSPRPVPSEPEVFSQTTPTPSHPDPNGDLISFEQKPEFWYAVYHPEVNRALDLRLAHKFTYDSPVFCVKISPDGQRLAVGDRGKTYLNELQTGSNIWSVLESLF